MIRTTVIDGCIADCILFVRGVIGLFIAVILILALYAHIAGQPYNRFWTALQNISDRAAAPV